MVSRVDLLNSHEFIKAKHDFQLVISSVKLERSARLRETNKFLFKICILTNLEVRKTSFGCYVIRIYCAYCARGKKEYSYQYPAQLNGIEKWHTILSFLIQEIGRKVGFYQMSQHMSSLPQGKELGNLQRQAWL